MAPTWFFFFSLICITSLYSFPHHPLHSITLWIIPNFPSSMDIYIYIYITLLLIQIKHYIYIYVTDDSIVHEFVGLYLCNNMVLELECVFINSLLGRYVFRPILHKQIMWICEIYYKTWKSMLSSFGPYLVAESWTTHST